MKLPNISFLLFQIAILFTALFSLVTPNPTMATQVYIPPPAEKSPLPVEGNYCTIGFYSEKELKQALITLREQQVQRLEELQPVCKEYCVAFRTQESSKEAFMKKVESTLKKYHGVVKSCEFTVSPKPGSSKSEPPKPTQRPLVSKKPVIYLYPEKQQEVLVQLHYKGTLIAHYPTYNPAIHGWRVIASPDGSLLNLEDRREYSSLFWEGIADPPIKLDLSYGFVVPGRESKQFLQKTLAQMGLSDKEANEFIVYWYPKMERNSYNLVQFIGEEYTKTAPLQIQPKPDSLLRVFMVMQRLEKPTAVRPQKLSPFVRKGFTVVEWGGVDLNQVQE